MSAFANEFLDLCTMVIAWQPMTSRDAFGKPNWGPAQTFPGRRVFKNERVAAYERGTKGEGAEVISASQIWILATPDIKYEDAVYVQGDAGPYPPILGIQKYPDESGFDVFVKVLLGSSNG